MREPPFQTLPHPRPMALAGKRVLVLGLGDTGLSAARWVAAEKGLPRVADTRAVPPRAGDLGGAELVTGPFDIALLDGADLLCISPGLPLSEPVVREALARGIPVVGDIELFALAVRARSRAKVLAITGTNGKTTVTALAGHLLRASGMDCEAAGNIGPPALDALMRRRAAAPEVWVLELSSYQLETTWSLEPDAAALLNISEDHLDRYPGIEHYAATKARIFLGSGMQVLNRDDPRSMACALPGRQVVTFGLEAPTTDEDFGTLQRQWLVRGRERILPAGELPIFGGHNVANALAACALACAAGALPGSLADGLRTFRGLPHRLQRVAHRHGVAWYDDSKGTNVGATIAAVRGLAQKVVLIAGGEGKGQDFSPLAPAAAECTSRVLLIGRDAPLIERALAASGVPVERCASIEQAVARAAECARPGEAVLLSPACASFDMFRDYRHRGEAFAAAVRALGD
jgi:UDP-N-acetylmuramoylalanine--D-glutamate ligase